MSFGIFFIAHQRSANTNRILNGISFIVLKQVLLQNQKKKEIEILSLRYTLSANFDININNCDGGIRNNWSQCAKAIIKHIGICKRG